jgi:hypothetical protein
MKISYQHQGFKRLEVMNIKGETSTFCVLFSSDDQKSLQTLPAIFITSRTVLKAKAKQQQTLQNFQRTHRIDLIVAQVDLHLFRNRLTHLKAVQMKNLQFFRIFQFCVDKEDQIERRESF